MNNKRIRTFYVLALAVILLTTASMSAQINAFQGANELMMTEQSTFLDFLGSTFGPDSSSKLHFTSVIDPKGQSFSFSLDPGSTYMGEPIALSVSGELDSSDQWHVSSSGSYRGSDFTVSSKYISSLSSGFGFQQPPAYNGALSNIYFAQRWNISPTCCWQPFTSTACTDVWSVGGSDYQYCYQVDPNTGAPIPGSAYYQYSQGMVSNGNTFNWAFNGANTGANYFGYIDTRGTSFTDGSQGSSTSVLSPLSVSTTTFFADLGSGANVYNPAEGWQVSGNGALGGSFTAASQFTAAASGGVSRIDIGIGYLSGMNLFNVALYTDDGGLPGNELANWDSLSSQMDIGLCCGVVSLSDISGVSLSAGNNYFLVLQPTDINGTAALAWNKNSQNIMGEQLYSTDGGQTWNSNGQQLLGAFDLLSQPQGIMVPANQFQLSGPASITQIDLGVGYVSGDNFFTVDIFADNAGQPGQLLYESSPTSSGQHFAGCCGLVADAIPGGLSLAAGNYWLVLRPTSLESNTLEQWYRNSTGATGLGLFSLDGGTTWNSAGQQLLGAFDLLAGGETVYSNLGTKDTVYQCCSGLQISGGTLGPKSLVAKGGSK